MNRAQRPNTYLSTRLPTATAPAWLVTLLNEGGELPERSIEIELHLRHVPNCQLSPSGRKLLREPEEAKDPVWGLEFTVVSRQEKGDVSPLCLGTWVLPFEEVRELVGDADELFKYVKLPQEPDGGLSQVQKQQFFDFLIANEKVGKID